MKLLKIRQTTLIVLKLSSFLYIVPNVTRTMMDYKLMSRCPVFKGITENESEKLLNRIHFRIKKFGKNERIADEGEPLNKLMIILSGSVRTEIIDFSGNNVRIDDIEAPQPLAPAFLFGEKNRFPVTITGNTDGTLLVVPIAEFLNILQLNRQVLENYLHIISTRTQFLSQKIHFLSFKTIKEKMAWFLLEQAGSGNFVKLKNTQQQLAELFGVTRPSLARVFGELKSDGLIDVRRKTVTITDKNALNRIIING